MRNILVTGGTVFVSRYVAEYFAKKGDKVYVLNRNSKSQSEGVTLIEADRNDLGDKLKGYHFDVILDITASTKQDVENLVNQHAYDAAQRRADVGIHVPRILVHAALRLQPLLRLIGKEQAGDQ